ncbi:HmuY family protein [Natronospirillum operosum]|uniref:HmuY family protein n=1 Tax=Natronospirillum operosum TaxID=2759953 RepID=UPI001436C011|nr:HmuY family protein [Natronospirillum operosum]
MGGTLLLTSLVALGGCFDSSSSSSNGNNNGGGSTDFAADLQAGKVASVVVDASSYTDLTGVNLQTGVMTTDLSGDDWHVALQRYNIVMLNGGVAGTGSVTAALAHAQDAFYDGNGDPVENTFVNATPEMYLADLTYPYDPTDLDFAAEDFQPAFGAWSDWATYRSDLPAGRPGGGYVTANEDHYWAVRSTEGDNFIVQLLDNNEPLFDTRDTDASFDDAAIILRITPMSGDGSFDLTGGTELTAELDDPRGSVYIDLDAGTYSTSATADWDIRYTVETTTSAQGTGSVGVLRLNGGVTGDGNVALHVDSPYTEAEVNALDGSDTAFGFGFESDSADNVFTSNEWFRYGVAGGHRLHPNYRVFALDLDGDEATTDDIVLVQATRYYHPDSGTSGYITLRAVLLETP